jgi:hypothetical protein
MNLRIDPSRLLAWTGVMGSTLFILAVIAAPR